MKTINQNIEIFNTFDKAKEYFGKLTVPAIFVQGRGVVTSYFVEKTREGEETCIQMWPTKYDLIDTKSGDECWVNVYRAPYAGCTNAALYYTSLGYATKGDALAALDSPKSKNIRDRFIKTTSINL